MRKKERERFVKKAKELLLSLGAKQDGGEVYPFTFHTKAGRLSLSVTENATDGPGTVFTCFMTIPRPHGNSWIATRTAGNGTTTSSAAGTWKPHSLTLRFN